MFQEIVVAQGPSLTLELPAELVGKRIRVLAFEEGEGERLPEDGEQLVDEQVRALRLARLRAMASRTPLDLSDFRFDRNEATNYDEE